MFSTAYRWSPVSRIIPAIPNEARPQNRNLAGATVNAPGVELANSSHSHECIVDSRLQAAQRAADSEEELEVRIVTKKLKKSKCKPAGVAAVDEAAATSVDGARVASSQCYMFLLDRLYHCHRERFGEAYSDNVRFEIPALKVHRHGSKRTVIENFTDVASVLNRENEHVRLYLSVELGTECHLAPVSRLIIDGKFVCRQLEAVIKKYATEFVESPSLKGSFDTVLTRDPVSKLTEVVCNKTGSRRFVPSLRHTAHTTTKADRKKERHAT